MAQRECSVAGQSGLERVAVALDTANRATFADWCARFGPRVGVLKIGLEAYTALGPESIERALRYCPRVFLDLKLNDIPQTVAGAVRAARSLGVAYLTVHASGGASVLEKAVEAGGDALQLLAVTVLTHLDQAGLEALDLPGSGAERVIHWARLARDHGVLGVVCSPLEIRVLRQALGQQLLIVTPGIRPARPTASGDDTASQNDTVFEDDQRRVATPEFALAAGADLLVIGRPLTAAADPEQALAALERELRGVGAPALK